ncbi:MAG: hypothetical protein R3B67_14895, partial [Phycisphaerales bacterium]
WFIPLFMKCVTQSCRGRGQSKFGKPCERLMAPNSLANPDMMVKMVVWTLGSLDFNNIGGILVFGLWSLVFGLWSLVFGLWSLVFGLWSLVFGLWSLNY